MEQTQVKARRGRPEKCNRERCEQFLALSVEQGRTLKALAAERHLPYVTLITALKRHGLSPRAKGHSSAPVATEPAAA